MNFRPGSNVADLTLHKDGRIDCFEGFDRFFGLAHVLLEWLRGKIEDDGIKPGPGRFYGLRQGMGMIRVKKDWAVAFLPQTPHESRNLPDSEKLPFALGRADHHRDLQFLPGCQHRLHQNPVRDVEMADCHSIFLTLLQSIPKPTHASFSSQILPQFLLCSALRHYRSRRQALATEAIAECVRSSGVREAESNIDLLDLVSIPAAADWN